MKIVFFLIFLFTSLTLKVFTQDNTLTLQDAVKIALENNYSIKIAESSAKIDENNLTMGNAGFLPFLDATGRLNRASQDVEQEFLDGRRIERDGAKSNAYEGSLSLNWTIFDGFRMFVNYDRLTDLKDIGQLRLKSQVEMTLRDVINGFYNILRQQKALEVASENLKISRSRYQFTNDRFEVGTASRIELLQAGVDLNSDISDSLDQQISYDNMKIDFNRLLNLELDNDFTVAGDIEIDSEYSKNVLEMIDNNIDVKISNKIVEINKYDIEALRSEFYPRIAFYSNFNYSRQESEAGFVVSNTSRGLNYGLNLSVNIFDGLNTSRQVENAQVSVEISEYMLRELRLAVKSAVSTSLNGFIKFKELSRFESQNVEAARENMVLAEESLNLGLMSALEFRETQRRLANAKLRLITSVYNAKINETELLRLTGSLVKEH
ncbi:MAG: TolC family protein [Candidatus Kapabacteria bacterium]|nr:TolC family protein [Ignavibacteriota bacterium]MCW5885480.1 TolC family protein [Candidatus Kapabacteria bacterium]